MKKLVLLSALFMGGCSSVGGFSETCIDLDMTASVNVAIFPTVGFGKVNPKVCFKSDEEIQDDTEGR